MAAWNTQEWRRIETALHQDPSKYRPGFQDWLVRTLGQVGGGLPWTTRKSVDWDAIEPDFRAGTKSIRQIAKENSITHGAVNQHAKLHGWTRDLTAKVRQATRSKLTADALSTPLSADSGVDTEKDAEIVDANAELRANIVRDHRGDIRAARALTKRMLAELQQQSGSPETLEAFAEIVATTVKDGERKTDEKSLAAFKKALGAR